MTKVENIEKKSLFEKFVETISEIGTFIIAIIVIGSFVFFTYIMIVSKPFTFEDFKDIAAIWGVWVGSVIGYYFGSRQVESLTNKIDALLKENESAENYYEDIIEDYENDLDDYKEKYMSAVSIIHVLVAKCGKNLEGTDLLASLKDKYGVYS